MLAISFKANLRSLDGDCITGQGVVVLPEKETKRTFGFTCSDFEDRGKENEDEAARCTQRRNRLCPAPVIFGSLYLLMLWSQICNRFPVPSADHIIEYEFQLDRSWGRSDPWLGLESIQYTGKSQGRNFQVVSLHPVQDRGRRTRGQHFPGQLIDPLPACLCLRHNLGLTFWLRGTSNADLFCVYSDPSLECRSWDLGKLSLLFVEVGGSVRPGALD